MNMNQTVINSKQNIDAACSSCFRQLVNYSAKVRDHKKEVERVAALPYIQEEKMRQIDELEAKTKAQLSSIYTAVIGQIDVISEAAEAIAEAPMDSVDLSAVGTLVSITGGGSSAESAVAISGVLQDYAYQYRGQQKALRVIKAAMERMGDSGSNVLKSKYGGSLIFSVSERTGKLYRITERLQDINLSHAFDLARELEVFAYDMGVELADNFKKMMNAVNPDDYEGAYLERMASLMGLDSQV